MATIMFMKQSEEGTFLQTVAERPDAYGPFWTATTLIFIISATSNITRYLNKGFSYDFSVRSRPSFTSLVALLDAHEDEPNPPTPPPPQPLLRREACLPASHSHTCASPPRMCVCVCVQLVTFCVSLVYGYLLAVTLALWLGCKYIVEKPMAYMSLICLVGYSFFIYIPCAVMTSLPSFLFFCFFEHPPPAHTLSVRLPMAHDQMLSTLSFLSWPALAVGLLGSTLFVLKSLVPVLSERKEKAMPVVMVYVLGQLVFMLILKFKFYGH